MADMKRRTLLRAGALRAAATTAVQRILGQQPGNTGTGVNEKLREILAL